MAISETQSLALNVALDFPVTNTVSASYYVGGSAQYGADHNLLSGHIVIPANTDRAIINLSTYNNPWADGSRTVIITLVQPINALLSEARKAVVITISDGKATRRTIFLPVAGR